MDPITLLMFGLIAVLIFFMFRNGKKRQAAQQELQNSLRPGAEVMLQSGIFGTIEEIDEEDNRATIRSGNSSIVVHRSAIGQVVKPVDALISEENTSLAPDDDPEFGERVAKEQGEQIELIETDAPRETDDSAKPVNGDDEGPAKPQA